MWKTSRSSDPDRASSGARVRTRWAAIGAAVAVTLGSVGIGGYNIVNAGVTSGERAVLVAIDSCRLADTRAGEFNVGPRATPLGAEETHTFSSQQTDVPCTGKIPASATSLALNVTATQATAPSFLTFWSGGPLLEGSSLNPTPGQPPIPNAVTVKLAAGNTFNVYNLAGTVEVVIDVVGYYEDHNHDDRYYTKAQSSAIAQERVDAGTADFLNATQIGAIAQERVDAGTADFLNATQIGAIAQERIDASQPTEIRLESTDFMIDARSKDDSTPAVGWTRKASAFRIAGTVESECIRAKVPLNAGTTVTDISIRYTGGAGQLDATLLGVTSNPGPADFGGAGSNQLANQQGLAVPASGGNTVGDLNVALTGTPTAVAGHVHQFVLCTDDPVLAILAVVLTTA